MDRRQWLLTIAFALALTARLAPALGYWVEEPLTLGEQKHLAVGEGDMSANPWIPWANRQLRAVDPGLGPDDLEAAYDRQAPGFICAAERFEAVERNAAGIGADALAAAAVRRVTAGLT